MFLRKAIVRRGPWSDRLRKRDPFSRNQRKLPDDDLKHPPKSELSWSKHVTRHRVFVVPYVLALIYNITPVNRFARCLFDER